MLPLLSLVAGALGAPSLDLQPAASAADIAPLQRLLDETGWEATPELSGIFAPGAVFSSEGGQHRLMARGCVAATPETHPYTSMELVRQLQAGVSVRTGFGRVKAEGALVKRLTFGVPEHHSLPRLELELTEACASQLHSVPTASLRHLYVVQEVLMAQIAEQTCGRVDAKGRFVGLGEAEAELAAACEQVSLEPVAVGYRTVPLQALLTRPASQVALAPTPAVAGCPWGAINTFSSTMTTVTINGETRDVRGLDARTALVTDLQRCGYPEAAAAFHKWRSHRRATNIAGATLVGMYPFGIGLYTAWQAGKWRERMELLVADPSAAEGGERWMARVAAP